jgi:hypothetical protein
LSLYCDMASDFVSCRANERRPLADVSSAGTSLSSGTFEAGSGAVEVNNTGSSGGELSRFVRLLGVAESMTSSLWSCSGEEALRLWDGMLEQATRRYATQRRALSKQVKLLARTPSSSRQVRRTSRHS